MKNKGILIGSVIFIILLGVGGYFMFGKKKDGNATDNIPGDEGNYEQPTDPAEQYLVGWWLQQFPKASYLPIIAWLRTRPDKMATIEKRASEAGNPVDKQLVGTAYWYLKNPKYIPKQLK